jgi:hypothetical protein
VYTEKIDCFSFGVIIVQTLTREFPKPVDRLQEVELNHPGLPRGTVCVRVPEIDRRQNHISQVDPNHSLLPIALDCLKDKDSERPSAHQLCKRVAHDLKGMPKYSDSARAVQDNEEEIQQPSQQIRERDQTNSYRQQSVEGERQIGRVNQQLEASEQVEMERPKTPKDAEENLKAVELKYIKLKKVPGDREYPVHEFAKTMDGLSNYNPGLGYAFYEFTKPELIAYDKQVILMDKVWTTSL